MKTSLQLVLVAGSLAANAILFLSLPAVNGPRMDSSGGGSKAMPGSGAAAIGNLAGDLRETAIAWDELAPNDLPKLVAHLRAQGFPPAVVRNIVWQLTSKQFEERAIELQGLNEPYAYWSAGNAFSTLGDAKTRAAQRELSKEHRKLVNDLLGSEDVQPASELARQMNRRRFGDLAAEKIEMINQINTDYSDLTTEVRRLSGGLLLREDREAMAFLEVEKQKDLQAMLAPSEYEDYMLRTSTTANQMRSQLVGMEPNEQEFRAIYALQSEFDQAFGTNMRRNTPEWQAERRAAEQQLIADVKAALGSERGVEYERARDPNYVQAITFAQNSKLPKETGVQIWQLQQETQQRAGSLRGNRSLTPEQQNEQLAALAREVETKLISSVGEAGLEEYKNSAGRWMQTLQPRPAPGARGGMIGGAVGGNIIFAPAR